MKTYSVFKNQEKVGKSTTRTKAMRQVKRLRKRDDKSRYYTLKD